MIIDSHVHLKHGDVEGTEYAAGTIVEIMDAVDIGKSVVFAISTTTKHSIEMAQEAASEFPDRLIPYANVEPSYGRPALEQIDEAISELGFRGMKIHLGYGVPPLEAMKPFLELAGRHAVPCLIDCKGMADYVGGMARACPRTKIIVAHLGQYLCEDEALIDRFIALAQAHDNIFLDVSGVVIPGKIKEAVQRLGAGRVFFGTDGPHPAPDLVTFARTELDKIRGLALRPDDEAAVLGGALAELLCI